ISWPHLILVIVVAALAVAALALFISALVSIGRSRASGTEKAVWILIVLVFPMLGALVWFLIGQNSAGRRGEFPGGSSAQG
ncbi:MAG TPA: PLD nuclease N-terminal domain-containing protein, partial [Microbacterium sp.]|nr:PLD nuclease N-terminal domain-containing protein [Microbacterium sp.]